MTYDRLLVYQNNGPNLECTTARNGNRRGQILLFLLLLSLALVIGGIWNGADQNR